MTGERLGDYTIDRELGSGGMGKVYAATGPDGVVALKVVHPHLLETPGFFKRFMREAQVGQSIRHDNVVRTLDCDQDFGGGKPQCFLVMEYVEGQTLSELLRELERVPEELCRHVAREICKGLAAVHEAGVVHRDLKPENVLITPEHVVKVMDLGVAQVADEALRLSRSGAFVGSVEYAAPEQFRGGDVDGRTDLHALGVLLYELSSGQHPYRAGGFHEAMQRICDSEPRRLGEVNPQLSAFFEEVVHTLLVKDPRGRFASATQLLDVLDDGEDSAWWHERARKLQAETRRPIRRIRIARETAVFGRDAELAALGEAFEKAKGGDGQVVLIEGEAGIGKSRLVDELVARLHADGEEVNFLFGSYPPGGAATASGAFSSAYREQLGEAGCADYLPQSRSLVPAFDALLRGEGPPPDAVPLTKDSLQTCFVNVTRALADERTTIVLIDDLHFAPDEGRALFTSLALAAPGARILLVGTTRPGVSEEWTAGLTRLEQTRQLQLHRLGPKDLAAMLRECFRSEQLAIGLAGQIGAKSDGNPFFAFEIIRGLREGQFITQRDDGTWASTRVIEDIEIPSSVLDLVNARVADLAEEERDILDVACCLGFEFDPLLVGDVLGLARIPLLKRLGQIERRHRLVRSSGLRYVFDHHQVQEALYGSLSELLRREYHAALADALEARAGAAAKDPAELDGSVCVDLCDHFLRGAQGERALRYLRAAQDHLTSSYLPAQMVALTERALAVPGLLTGIERAGVLTRLAGVVEITGDRVRQESSAREALALAESGGDDESRSDAVNMVGVVLMRTARLDEGEEVYRREIARADADGREPSAVLEYGLSNVLATLGRHEEARAGFERCVARAVAAGDRSLELQARYMVCLVLSELGRLQEAERLAEQVLALSRELRDRQQEGLVCMLLGNMSGMANRFDDAFAYLTSAREILTEIGHRQGEAYALRNIAATLEPLGDFAGAVAHLEPVLAILRQVGDRVGEATALGMMAASLHQQGRRAEAEDCMERALTISRELALPALEAELIEKSAHVLWGNGELHGAVLACERSLAILRGCEGEGSGAVELVNIAGLWHELGEPEKARDFAEQALRASRDAGFARPESFALHHMACLADDAGDLDAALRLFEESLAIRRAIRHRVGVTRSLLRIGDLHRRAGRTDEARAAFDEAAAVAEEIHARDMLAMARAQLACLPGADESAVHAAVTCDAGHEDTPHRLRLLYQATGDRAHLVAAKRLLDEVLAKIPPEFHEGMCTRIRDHRELLAAWRALPADSSARDTPDHTPDDDGPRGTESVTRVG